MQSLDQDYKERLQGVAELIQGSDELAAYLDEESADQYKLLQDTYEPLIAELYQEVADQHPLQILSLEKVLINPFFEGLYLPKILGYSVLRAELNEELKSVRPLDHFKDILYAISSSANFDVIKQRIGQTVQFGFAISSEIWISNLLDGVENKKVKAFLQSMRLDKFRDLQERKLLIERYKKQFAHSNYFTAKFPSSVNELKVEAATLKSFLLNRIKLNAPHDSYLSELNALISNQDFKNENEYLELLFIIANFVQLGEKENSTLQSTLADLRKSQSNFNQQYFQFLKKYSKDALPFGAKSDRKFFEYLDKSGQDDLIKYYRLMETIHAKGFVHDDVLDAVNAFYSQYEGMSINNECLRLAILRSFHQVIDNLTEPEYNSFFELYKTQLAYINIFGNSAFNQEMEFMSMNYVQKLLAFYKDKRSKEYQDVKKFVSSHFTELEFLTEKEVVDLFKIKRKKKAQE